MRGMPEWAKNANTRGVVKGLLVSVVDLVTAMVVKVASVAVDSIRMVSIKVVLRRVALAVVMMMSEVKVSVPA